MLFYNDSEQTSYEKTLNCYLCDGYPLKCPNRAYSVRDGEKRCYWKKIIEEDEEQYRLLENKDILPQDFYITFDKLPQVIKDIENRAKSNNW